MHRLLYTSEADLPATGDAESDVRALARSAAARNADLGITGALIHVEGTFIQVLEGELDRLETIFESICCDFRHRDVRLIDLVPIKARLFDRWDMACLAAGEQTEIRLTEELKDVRFLVGVNAREAVLGMRKLLDEETGLRNAA